MVKNKCCPKLEFDLNEESETGLSLSYNIRSVDP